MSYIGRVDSPQAFFLMLPFFFNGLERVWEQPWHVRSLPRGFKVPTLSRNPPLNEADEISIVSTSAIELAGLPHDDSPRTSRTLRLNSFRKIQSY